ncbi:PH domain-containing protein [Pseudonocardia xishanensis]|uniref:PH domain-containing protein n=1 Tax=Pseudonocardia xishanensis TaxID=630995 RepID=UPI0031EC58A3
MELEAAVDPAAWTPLDPRTVPVSAVLATVTVAVAGAAAVVTVAAREPAAAGTAALGTLAAAIALVTVTVLVSWARWRCCAYRVTADRVELRTGVLVQRRRSMPLERARAVDVTAGPVLRAFGLVALRIGTGQQRGRGEATLALRPVDRMDAERLRTLLLDRMRSAGGPPAGPADGRIAELDPRWLRYGPLSLATPVLGLGLTAVLVGLLDPPVWVAAVAVLPVGALVAVLLYVETWSGFRLDREPGDVLRVRRGGLVTRSISLEERRLVGIELVEPLGVRLSGAARVDAVATGLLVGGTESTEHRTLLPTAPRRLAERVAAVVLGQSPAPTAAPLTGHPRAARDRRLRRGALAAVGPAAVLVVVGVLTGIDALLLAGIGVLVLGVPVGVLWALDTYRGLGHGQAGEYLVVRAGSLRRSTVALHRDGVIGWTVRQSVLQRRRGLATVVATTAAGRGAFQARDVDAGTGLRWAATATPGLVGPFAARDEPGVPAARREQHQPGAQERPDPGEPVQRHQVEEHELADGGRHQHQARHP